MGVYQGIVRYIKTDDPDNDYFALESKEQPGHYTDSLSGPKWWLEDHLGDMVCVVDTHKHFSITVMEERSQKEFHS